MATLLIFWDPKITISWCFSDAAGYEVVASAMLFFPLIPLLQGSPPQQHKTTTTERETKSFLFPPWAVFQRSAVLFPVC